VPASSDSIGSLEISSLSLSQLNDRLRRIASALTSLETGSSSSGSTTGSASSSASNASGLWNNFTPTVTASGSMTVSALTVVQARYLRSGPTINIMCTVGLTLGGTLSNGIYFTVPVPAVGAGNQFAAWNESSATPLNTGWPSTAQILLVPQGNANYAAGAQYLSFAGSYQCA
jgi:hypothetical protein